MNSEDLGGAPSFGDLQALAERLSELSEPDRDTDAEIEIAFFGGSIVYRAARYTMDPEVSVRRPSEHHIGGLVNAPVPAFTASLDAAVALVERVLPGWIVESLGEHVYADHRAKGPWKCSLRSNPRLKGCAYAQCHYAPTAPLALIRALVVAKMEEGRRDTKDHPNAR